QVVAWVQQGGTVVVIPPLPAPPNPMHMTGHDAPERTILNELGLTHVSIIATETAKPAAGAPASQSQADDDEESIARVLVGGPTRKSDKTLNVKSSGTLTTLGDFATELAVPSDLRHIKSQKTPSPVGTVDALNADG